jgi:hypothetical protein
MQRPKQYYTNLNNLSTCSKDVTEKIVANKRQWIENSTNYTHFFYTSTIRLQYIHLAPSNCILNRQRHVVLLNCWRFINFKLYISHTLYFLSYMYFLAYKDRDHKPKIIIKYIPFCVTLNKPEDRSSFLAEKCSLILTGYAYMLCWQTVTSICIYVPPPSKIFNCIRV